MKSIIAKNLLENKTCRDCEFGFSDFDGEFCAHKVLKSEIDEYGIKALRYKIIPDEKTCEKWAPKASKRAAWNI